MQTLLKLHRWVALVSAAFLILVSLSGAMLVFEDAIDRGLNPGLWHVTSASDVVLPLDTLMSRATAVAGGEKVSSLTIPATQDRAYVVGAGRGLAIFINPYSGAVQGTRTADERNRGLARRVHVFHETLMAGETGGALVGIVSVAALFLSLGGIILWWPRRIIRVNGKASWKRIVFDLHHVLGICAAIVLVAITASATAIKYRSVGAMVVKLDHSPPAQRPKESIVIPGAAPISADSAVRVARAALPGAAITNMFLPGGGKDVLLVSMRFPEDRTPGGRSRIFIDQYSGRVLLVQNTRTAELGTRLDNLKRSIHTGDLFGKPTEFIWLLATFVMAEQAMTGFVMWRNRSRGSRTA
ncbi:MAG: PepSY domain-containing protein [Gemmatimonadota bacterium]|nr:PepSY domain-containing protein [Gemmatimonadota bacterium]